MNFKTTIVLIVILAAVGIWLLVDQYTGNEPAKTASNSAQSTVEGKPLFEVPPEQISKLTISPAQGPKVVLQKAAGKWQIESPLKAPAETWEVDGLVRDLVGLRSRGQVEANAATGLEQPRYQIQLDSQSGKTVQFAVGDKTAIGDAMYIRLDGQKKAEVVDADAYAKLAKPLEDYRDKHLMNVSATDIKQLRVTRPGKPALVLEKEGSQWRMTQPKAMPADESAVSDLLFALSGAQAVEYVPADQAKSPGLQLDHPQATVWFSTAPPTTRPATKPATQPTGTTLTFGGYDTILKENVYATLAGSDTVVTLPVSTLNTFEKIPLQLRDKTVLNLDPQEVQSFTLAEDRPATTQPTTQPAVKKTITVERRPVELTLGPGAPAMHPATTQAMSQSATTQATTKPAESKWLVRGEHPAGASDQNVEKLLSALHPLKAEQFLETAPATKPVATYTLTLHTDRGATQMLQLHEQGPTEPLIGVGDGLTFEVDRTILATLNADFSSHQP
jgi:hypothetical protein